MRRLRKQSPNSVEESANAGQPAQLTATGLTSRPPVTIVQGLSEQQYFGKPSHMTDDDLAKLFMPEDVERRATLLGGQRLAHYTSAEAGYRIIAGGEVWLRNALLMNDFSEIQHGVNCLQQAWWSPPGKNFQSWLDRVMPGFTDQIVQMFDTHADGFRVATFMMSLSEHDDDEDEFGRLSMWRAYGRPNGVALILNPLIFSTSTDELKAYSAPVNYQNPAQFVVSFEEWSKRIAAHEAQLVPIERDRLLNFFFYTFRMFVLCTKHPGFREEREWRVFHSPLVDGASSWLRKDTEILNGVPQEIIKISLRNQTSAGVEGLSPADLVDRVIIGPSQHPIPTYHALYNALSAVGIAEPGTRLSMSLIPLRQ